MAVSPIFSAIEPYCDAVIASEITNWSFAMQEHIFVKPVKTIAIAEDDLFAILTQNAEFRDLHQLRSAKNINIENFDLADLTLKEEAFFPKIGPVSWKEFPLLFPVPRQEIQRWLPILLSTISARMAAILNCFYLEKTPAHLYFFPYRDISHCGELRIEILNSKIKLARWLYHPDNIFVTKKLREDIRDFVVKMIDSYFIKTAYLDIFIIKNNENYTIRLAEINPVMTDDSGVQLFNV